MSTSTSTRNPTMPRRPTARVRPRVTTGPRRHARSGRVRGEDAARRRRRRDPGDAWDRGTGGAPLREPGQRQPPQPASWRWSTASIGCPNGGARRVLTSTTTRQPPSRATMSISPRSHRQFWSMNVEALVGEVAHRHPLAVAAEPMCGVPRHPRDDGSRTVHGPTVPVGMRDAPPRPRAVDRGAKRSTHVDDRTSPLRPGDASSDRDDETGKHRADDPSYEGSLQVGLGSSSMLTSLNVTTRTVLTKRAGRQMSHTHASCTSRRRRPHRRRRGPSCRPGCTGRSGAPSPPRG